MPSDDRPGEHYEMELLRPQGWVEQNTSDTGWVYLSLPELGVSGQAEVLNISACPPIEAGAGRVVLSTFTYVSNEIIELHLNNGDSLRATEGHPMWSLDRGDWVSVGELEPGETVATEAGVATISSVTPVLGEHRVYNIDVEADNRYLVGDLGVLVHNANPCNFQNQNPRSGTAGQRLNKPASSRVLSDNLEAAGVPRPSGSAAHHMVAGGSSHPSAAQARTILANEGIDINEASNGVFLPKNRSVAAPPVATHSILHTNKYYDTVLNRLQAASPGTHRDVLDIIRSELIAGTFPF